MNTPQLLPGQTLTAGGHPRLDYAAVAALAFPFMLNSAVQAILNVTDTWFIGHLSPTATAAIGAVYWPVLMFVLLFGGVGLSVQTSVAQAQGGGRLARASQAAWTALWAASFTVPVFLVLALAGRWIFAPFDIGSDTLGQALDYWSPRMLGAPLGIALWVLLGFFNGIGRPIITLHVTLGVAIANAVFNELFVFNLHLGVAGSAWATGAAQFVGVAFALVKFLNRNGRVVYRTHLTWRLIPRLLIAQLRLGIPMGVLSAADIMGFALFQLMQVRLGTIDGAASQIVMILTSFSYMPGVGIAMAGTTLVGQAIGAKTLNWAARLGNSIIALAVGYMGLSGLLLAAAGPWILPLFTNAGDPQSRAVAMRGCVLLWIAAGYQFFDGLNLGGGACLRGAGDVKIPSLMVLALSWGMFVPLAHMLSFQPGRGWVSWLPQLGFGALGGWFAAVTYICCLGVAMFLRWNSGAWRRAVLPVA